MKWNYLMATVLTALLLSGCTGKASTPPATKPGLEAIRFDNATPRDVLLAGRATFEKSCSTCHALPTSEQVNRFATDEALVTFGILMTRHMANLDDEAAEKVIRYLLALRHDAAP